MAGKSSRIRWHQQNAYRLENDRLRVVIVPQMGAKIVSLFDKDLGLEWLVGPGSRSFEPVPYGATFIDQDMSGWDEMFPTIVACSYPGPEIWGGNALPDHGEVWAMPWDVLDHSESGLTCAVEGKALPYRLSRVARLGNKNSLDLTYELENLGSESFSYIWAAHPQFRCGENARIHFPDRIQQVINTLPAEYGWGEPGQIWNWPESKAEGQDFIRLNQIGSQDLKQARKFFLAPDERIGWVEIQRTNPGACLRMEWSPQEIPYFGIWVDEGAIAKESVAAPEPTTGYYDSLDTAWNQQEVSVVGPSQKVSWNLSVFLNEENSNKGR
jgi:galactose mutarotase-like enzyme